MLFRSHATEETRNGEDTATALALQRLLQEVMPFVYVPNLYAASEWILENVGQTAASGEDAR